MSWLFASGGQSIGVSALVLPMNIQGWFPLGLVSLISFLSKELSRAFFSTTVQKHQFFGTQPSLWSSSHIHTWPLEKTTLRDTGRKPSQPGAKALATSMCLGLEVASGRERERRQKMKVLDGNTTYRNCEWDLLVRCVVWHGQEGFMERVAANKALKDRMTW